MQQPASMPGRDRRLQGAPHRIQQEQGGGGGENPGETEQPRQDEPLGRIHVATGGRLVYSTCSIAAEENDQVVQAFLASQAGGPFTLEKTVLSYPWTSGHDGGGAFLLRKSAS